MPLWLRVMAEGLTMSQRLRTRVAGIWYCIVSIGT